MKFRSARASLSRQQYDAFLEKQNNCCAICKIPFQELKRRPDIDHCHKTNVIRGLLCTRCNVVLGTVDERIEILTAAASYLQTDFDKDIRLLPWRTRSEAQRDPDVRKRQFEALKITLLKPEVRAKKSASLKKAYANGGSRNVSAQRL